MTEIRINKNTFTENTVIEIGKFIILWNMFEKEKCKTNCNTTKLKKLVEYKTTNTNWKNLADILKNRIKINDCNVDDYVDNKLSLGIGLKTEDKQYVKNFIDNNGENNLAGGLIAIYRIRNNMFHGLKDYVYLDAQIDLFRGINDFLENEIL